MKWKDTLPCLRGYYWIRNQNGCAEIAFAEVPDKLAYFINEEAPTLFDKLTQCEWYGPLPEPE